MRIVQCLALGVLLCSGLRADSVTGSVVDQTQAAVAGARVTLAGDAARPERSTLTDALGRFRFEQVERGGYRLAVEKPRFEIVSQPVTVEAAPLELAPVVLTASAVHTAVTVMEMPGYEIPVVMTATKTPTEAIDIPQSVQPVARTVINDQAALSMNDVLRNVPGVSPSLGEGRRDHMLIRGFNAVNDEYIDGVRDDALYYRDLSNVETVEVLKGPSAVLFGRGTSGGLVNRITKKPDSERPLGSLKILGGSYGAKRGEFDASEPWFDGKLAGRLTGAYEDSGSFRDYFNLKRYAFSPGLQWSSGERTTLLAQFDYLNDERLPDRGIPSLNGVPAPVRDGAYYGYPDEDHIRTHAASLGLTLRHNLSTSWTLRDVFRETGHSTDFSNTYPNGVTTLDGSLAVLRGQYNSTMTQQNVFNQLEVTGTGSWMGLGHVLLAGVEGGHQSRDTARFTGSAGPVALVNPVLTRPSYSAVPSTLNGFTGVIAGAYVQEQISWRRWRVLAGLRRDYYDQTQDSRLPGTGNLGRTDTAWSPRLGIVYRAADWIGAYASYTRSFSPSGEGLSLAENNEQLRPEKTRNLEAGIKTDLLRRRLSATAAVFRLDRTNIKTVDPQNPLLLILVGAQRTDGVEFSLTGRVWRSLDVTGGYAWYDAAIRRSNSLSSGVPIEGKLPALVPKRSGNLWATYFWNNGFGLGGGVFQASRRFTANDDLVALPGYVRFDAALFYRTRRWGFALNTHNLLNRHYYETAQSNSQIYPGAPANGLLSMTYRW